MKNILFLTRSLAFGGAERQLVLLAKKLANKGYKVNIALFYNEGGLLEDIEGSGVNVHILNKKSRWDLWGFVGSLYKLVKKVDPDIVHGYLVVPNIMLIILKLLGCKKKCVWGVRASDMDFEKYDWSAGLTFKLSCICSKYADLIIVNSFAGKAFHLENGYPEKKMVVVSNGIDVEMFKPDQNLRKQLRIEWGIPDDILLIGIVARLDPMKNHKLFLNAAIKYADSSNNVRFVVIGDGPDDYKAMLKEIGRELEDRGELIWAGERNDMQAVYNALDVFTNCSAFGEGFPNVIGESMACGTPCVVTDVGDSAYVVDKYGIVLSRSNVEHLIDAWAVYGTKKKSTYDVEVRNRIVEFFTPEVLVNNTDRHLIELFEKN